MPPAWLLDSFAALMLVIAAVGATRLAVARLASAHSLSVAESTGSRLWPHSSSGADNDIAHLLMGIAMAGMLAASVTTLPSRAGEATFGVLTAWFAWRIARDTRANGIRSLASGHSAVHVLHCGAMVYLFAAIKTSSSMQMTGMGGGVAPSVGYPILAVAFSAASACYSAWDLGHLSRRRHTRVVASAGDTALTARVTVPTTTAPSGTSKFSAEAPFPLASEMRLASRGLLLSPAAAAACRIAMGVTMAYMLLIMT